MPAPESCSSAASRTIPYAEFGEAFIAAAVSPERVVAAIRRIAGDTFVLAPMRAGPGRAASVRAEGTIGVPQVEPRLDGLIAFSVRLPVELRIDVRVGTHATFDAVGEVELRLTVRTADPPAIVIDVDEVGPSDVHFQVRARGLHARVLEWVGDLEGELRRYAAAYVNQQVGSPEAKRLARVELAPLIEHVWEGL